ncbi:hypothetical protein [Novosphingobium sp.]|uniref:hypothetical protein n=1 Tax=Novosphingobium sp. TaxID=1874826 RepID=UPI002636E3E4|nr:hypothetical protein [Novosphingobium sp.]
MSLLKVIKQWTRREELAVRQQFYGKTIRERFRGLRRSERNEAKLFLIAMLPTLLTMPFIGKWSDASLAGKCIMMITGLWMLGILIFGGYLLLRSIYRSSHQRED